MKTLSPQEEYFLFVCINNLGEHCHDYSVQKALLDRGLITQHGCLNPITCFCKIDNHVHLYPTPLGKIALTCAKVLRGEI